MLVQELMTRDVVTTTTDTTISEAVRQLDRHGITSMPVLDVARCLVGIVSEADLLRDALAEDPRGSEVPQGRRAESPPDRVGEVMTRQLVTVTEQVDAARVASLMLETGIKSLPVVRGGQVVGVVSRSDLIHALATTDARLSEQVEALLHDCGYASWTVSVDGGDVTLALPPDHVEPSDVKLAQTLARAVTGVRSARVDLMGHADVRRVRSAPGAH